MNASMTYRLNQFSSDDFRFSEHSVSREAKNIAERYADPPSISKGLAKIVTGALLTRYGNAKTKQLGATMITMGVAEVFLGTGKSFADAETAKAIDQMNGLLSDNALIRMLTGYDLIAMLNEGIDELWNELGLGDDRSGLGTEFSGYERAMDGWLDYDRDDPFSHVTDKLRSDLSESGSSRSGSSQSSQADGRGDLGQSHTDRVGGNGGNGEGPGRRGPNGPDKFHDLPNKD